MTSPTTGPLRLTRAFLVAVLALFAVVLVLGAPAAPASAHDALISVTPADGSTVEVAPATVELVFDQPAIALGTQIRVLGPDGTTVSAGAPVLVGSTVSQPLAASRPAGTYTVQWRVTSADGHPVSGQFTFTATSAATAVAAGPPTPTVTDTPAPTPSATATPAAEPDAGVLSTGISPWAVVAGTGVVMLLAAGAIWWVRRAGS